MRIKSTLAVIFIGLTVMIIAGAVVVHNILELAKLFL